MCRGWSLWMPKLLHSHVAGNDPFKLILGRGEALVHEPDIFIVNTTLFLGEDLTPLVIGLEDNLLGIFINGLHAAAPIPKFIDRHFAAGANVKELINQYAQIVIMAIEKIGHLVADECVSESVLVLGHVIFASQDVQVVIDQRIHI